MSKIDKALRRGQRKMDRLTEEYANEMAWVFNKVNGVLASAGCVCKDELIRLGNCNCPSGADEDQWAKLTKMDEAHLRALHLPKDHDCQSDKCWKANR